MHLHKGTKLAKALNYICNKMSAQSLHCTSEGMTEDRPAWHPSPSLLLQPTMHTKHFWWNQEYKLCLIQAGYSQTWLSVALFFFFAKTMDKIRGCRFESSEAAGDAYEQLLCIMSKDEWRTTYAEWFWEDGMLLTVRWIIILKILYIRGHIDDNLWKKNLCHSRDSNHRSLVLRTGALTN